MSRPKTSVREAAARGKKSHNCASYQNDEVQVEMDNCVYIGLCWKRLTFILPAWEFQLHHALPSISSVLSFFVAMIANMSV